jgi:aspartate racemase
MKKGNKIIGLIGGMGPYASAYFYQLLLKKSSDLYGAKNNDDFPEILIDSVPVPDFITNTNGLEVAKNILISRIKKLNSYGVGSIAMICNTSHILYDDLTKISKARF